MGCIGASFSSVNSLFTEVIGHEQQEDGIYGLLVTHDIPIILWYSFVAQVYSGIRHNFLQIHTELEIKPTRAHRTLTNGRLMMVRQMIKSSSIPLLVLLILALIIVVGCGGAADVPEEPKPAVVTDASAGTGTSAVEEPAKQTTAQNQPPAAEATRTPDFSTKAPTPAPVEAAPAQVHPWKAYVGQGKYGGTLMIGDSSQPDQWDLHKACCNFSPSGARDIYNNLVYYDPLNQVDIIGDLAESWDWAGDGLSITFHIHGNATWSHGVSVTADDVKYSLDRMALPGVPRPRVKNIVPYYDRSEMIDPTTVKVYTKFARPAAFLRFLATDYMVIVPKHVLEAAEDSETAFDDPRNIVGSGFSPGTLRKGPRRTS